MRLAPARENAAVAAGRGMGVEVMVPVVLVARPLESPAGPAISILWFSYLLCRWPLYILIFKSSLKIVHAGPPRREQH